MHLNTGGRHNYLSQLNYSETETQSLLCDLPKVTEKVTGEAETRVQFSRPLRRQNSIIVESKGFCNSLTLVKSQLCHLLAGKLGQIPEFFQF